MPAQTCELEETLHGRHKWEDYFIKPKANCCGISYSTCFVSKKTSRISLESMNQQFVSPTSFHTPVYSLICSFMDPFIHNTYIRSFLNHLPVMQQWTEHKQSLPPQSCQSSYHLHKCGALCIVTQGSILISTGAITIIPALQRNKWAQNPNILSNVSASRGVFCKFSGWVNMIRH